MTGLTADELRGFDHELRQRDPRFLRVVEANADEGLGEYELRTATGATARAAFTFCCEHRRLQTPAFDAETRLRLGCGLERPARSVCRRVENTSRGQRDARARLRGPLQSGAPRRVEG
jgi:hypothetical protein